MTVYITYDNIGLTLVVKPFLLCTDQRRNSVEDDMNSKFFDVKKDKQDAIINAALKTFALKGYKDASTDVMSKRRVSPKGCFSIILRASRDCMILYAITVQST